MEQNKEIREEVEDLNIVKDPLEEQLKKQPEPEVKQEVKETKQEKLDDNFNVVSPYIKEEKI